MDLSNISFLFLIVITLTVGGILFTGVRTLSDEQSLENAPRMREYTEEFMTRFLQGDVLNRTRAQLIADLRNRRFLPSLHSKTERWPFGLIVLGSVMYSGKDSVLFEVATDDILLVKYQADCDAVRMNTIHPLMTDYWYGKAAFDAGVSPRPLFLSPPILFRENSGKLGTIKLGRRRQEQCASEGGAVRFMILTRVINSETLCDYFSTKALGKPRFLLAMGVGVVLIKKLRILHQVAQVVHGDIHMKNILIESYLKKPVRVWVIDYGRARSNSPAISKDPIYSSQGWYHPSLTHWQMRGFQWAARDDVYNALRTLAWVMNDHSYNDFEKELTTIDRTSLVPWRESMFIFSVPNGYDPIAILPISDDRKRLIKRSLNHILISVRSLNDVDDIPDYDFIISELQNCFRLANGM